MISGRHDCFRRPGRVPGWGPGRKTYQKPQFQRFIPRKFCFFVCVLTILLGHYFIHITRAKSELMSLMCLFKTVPGSISGPFL